MSYPRLQAQCTFSPVQESDLETILPIYNHYIVNTAYTFHCSPVSRDEMRILVLFGNERYKSFVIRDGE
jgi:L-amino acid N-acyltransferase YncA